MRVWISPGGHGKCNQLWSPAVQDLLSAIYDWVIGNYIIYIATDDTRYRLFGFWGFHMTQCRFYSSIALNNIFKKFHHGFAHVKN